MIKPSPTVVVPMRRALWMSIAVLIAAAGFGALIGSLVSASAGWAVVLGLSIPAIFFGVTIAVALVTAASGPTQLGIVVLGSWLLKMLVLILFLAKFGDSDFYDRGVFFGVFLAGIVAVLVGEALIVVKAKFPSVDV